MKVLHISGASSWGGNEQQLIDILPAQKARGLTVWVYGVKNSPLHKMCIENSIDFIFSEKKLSWLNKAVFLKKIIRKHKPNVIHLHTSNSVTNYVITDILFRLKTPTVFSKKGMGNNMSWLSIYKYNYSNINSIFCVSQAVKISMINKVLKRKNHNKAVVLYEGINIDRINNNSTDTNSLINKNKASFILGNIANHVPAKDLGVLIKAIHYLVNELKFEDFHLYQIGSRSRHTQALEDLITNLSLEKYITLCGFLENATSEISKFDIYVMSSEREGLPLTIYEAFYKKTPVVSTNAGGIPEIIFDNKNGYIVKTKNHKSLAEKILKLIKSGDNRKLFTDKSYEMFMGKFTVDKTVVKMIEAYREII